MSRFHFKAWDTKRKEWVANGETMDLQYSARCNSFMFDNDNYDLGKDVVLVQSTGLKDKQGKEIFEGDIIEHTQHGRMKVYWGPEAAGFMVDSKTISCPLQGACQKYITIIGNLYESPELLK